jgi:hypothetical protein
LQPVVLSSALVGPRVAAQNVERNSDRGLGSVTARSREKLEGNSHGIDRGSPSIV